MGRPLLMVLPMGLAVLKAMPLHRFDHARDKQPWLTAVMLWQSFTRGPGPSSLGQPAARESGVGLDSPPSIKQPIEPLALWLSSPVCAG
jgi:hypothetical protein